MSSPNTRPSLLLFYSRIGAAIACLIGTLHFDVAFADFADFADFAVISTNADPVTGAPLISKADSKRHWELYRGHTGDGGRRWTWTAITADSAVDHLRPIIPDWDSPKRAILWARGTLRTFTDYELDIVGILEDR